MDAEKMSMAIPPSPSISRAEGGREEAGVLTMLALLVAASAEAPQLFYRRIAAAAGGN